MSRFGWFVFGVIVTCGAIALGVFLYVKTGGVQMAVNSPEFPFETTFANMALHASFAGSLKLHNPVPFNEQNLTAGADLYRSHCAGCHGRPGQDSGMAPRMFPHPPQLFVPKEMVTGDPEGETYWKITNGIRLTGMPEFKTVLSETQRWQLASLLAHADKLPPAVETALREHPSH